MKKVSILSYWTFRYLLILCLGLVLVTAASVYWIRESTLENRLQITQFLAQEVAHQVVSPEGALVIPPHLNKLIEDRKQVCNFTFQPDVTITDAEGQTLFHKPPTVKGTPLPPSEMPPTASITPELVTVTADIKSGNNTLGTVSLVQPKRILTHVPNEYRLLTTLLIGLAVFGWITIYLLSRKLSRPVRRMSEAALEVSRGNYAVELDDQVKEKEIHDMIVSFKNMATRLKQLEELRAVMLAGVTHELKTPVTSIKGLVHAVREGVVDGEEANEFLDITLKEAERLQSMVTDLLDYNALDSGVVAVKGDRLSANCLVKEIAYQWSLVHENSKVEVTTHLPPDPLTMIGDSSRIQQILVNLLNNSVQAMQQESSIHILVTLQQAADGWIEVTVKDNGHGIPLEEQDFIFERYFRGDHKKHKVRGLGLGLTYSRMLARAQGGDLLLRESTSAGSVFVLRLPSGSEEQAEQVKKRSFEVIPVS